MEKILQSYLSAPDESTMKLTCRIHWPKAETELILYADGGYRLYSTHTKSRKKEEFAGYRDMEEVLKVIQQLSATSLASTTENQPVTLIFSADGEELTTRLPLDSDASKLLHAFIHEISKGLILTQ